MSSKLQLVERAPIWQRQEVKQPSQHKVWRESKRELTLQPKSNRKSKDGGARQAAHGRGLLPGARVGAAAAAQAQAQQKYERLAFHDSALAKRRQGDTFKPKINRN